MKRLLILFTVLIFAFSANAQKVNEFWGTAADTLTASVVKTQVIPIGTNTEQAFVISIFTDHVSGTDTYAGKLEYSLDGVNYHAILSAPDVSKAAGSDNSFAWSNRYYKTFSVDGDTTTIMVNSPILAKYLKVTLTSDATAQKSLCYGYYIITKYKD